MLKPIEIACELNNTMLPEVALHVGVRRRLVQIRISRFGSDISDRPLLPKRGCKHFQRDDVPLSQFVRIRYHGQILMAKPLKVGRPEFLNRGATSVSRLCSDDRLNCFVQAYIRVTSLAVVGSVNLACLLVEQGLLVESDGSYVLTQDYVFGSPFTAAMVLLGRTSNGRIEWKDSMGRH